MSRVKEMSNFVPMQIISPFELCPSNGVEYTVSTAKDIILRATVVHLLQSCIFTAPIGKLKYPEIFSQLQLFDSFEDNFFGNNIQIWDA